MKIEELNDYQLKTINGGGGIVRWIWERIGEAAGYAHNVTYSYGQAMSGGTCCDE